MTSSCPECGAELKAGDSCQAIFDSFLILEFTDPGYGEVHFLTVACFMIQHGRYSNEGLIWIERQMRAYLEQGIPVEQIRRIAAKEASPSERTWNVTRRPDAPNQPHIAWSMTIIDVACNSPDATSYCEQVQKWARITLREMQPLVSRP